MTDPALLTDKIQSYLMALSPRAVGTLVRGLERARQSGKGDPHVELILAASAALLRGEALHRSEPRDERPLPAATRRGHLERLFFSPLDTFLVNEHLPRKQEGRVYRPYLNEIWHWLERDLLPGEIRQARQDLEASGSDDEKAHERVAALRKMATQALAETMARASDSDRERRRLSMVLGGDRAFADLQDVTKLFLAEPWLTRFLDRMPTSLTERRLKQDTDVLTLVEAHARKHPDYIPMLAATVLDRADAPWSLGTFATRLAGTKKARDLSRSPFAPFMDVVISEAERLSILARSQRDNPDPVAFSEAVSGYASLMRGLEFDMDLSGADAWRGRLAETRREMSQIVTSELQTASGAVRRALAVPKVDRDGRWKADGRALDDAVRTLRVLAMARGTAETLAINDVSKRTRQTVEQTLEIITRSLLSEFAKQKGAARAAHLSAIDAAILLSEVYFGPDYAGQLRRSRQAALAAIEAASAA